MKLNIPKFNGATFTVTKQGLIAQFAGRNELVIANRTLQEQLELEGLTITPEGKVVAIINTNNENDTQPETNTETNTEVVSNIPVSDETSKRKRR